MKLGLITLKLLSIIPKAKSFDIVSALTGSLGAKIAQSWYEAETTLKYIPRIQGGDFLSLHKTKRLGRSFAETRVGFRDLKWL